MTMLVHIKKEDFFLIFMITLLIELHYANYQGLCRHGEQSWPFGLQLADFVRYKVLCHNQPHPYKTLTIQLLLLKGKICTKKK